MKKFIVMAALISASVASGAALIESKPVTGARAPARLSPPQVAGRVATLEVFNVGCISCAPLVKRNLTRVPGVKAVSVKEGSGPSVTVRVVYDHKKVTPAALANKITDAGYPAQVIKN